MGGNFLDLIGVVDWLQVLVATVIYFGLGAVWFNQNVFGKHWMKEIGIDMNDTEGVNMPAIFGGTFVVAFISMTVLNIFCASPLIQMSDALINTLVLFMGFTLPISVMNMLYEQRSAAFLAINSGYHLTGLLAGTILYVIW